MKRVLKKILYAIPPLRRFGVHVMYRYKEAAYERLTRGIVPDPKRIMFCAFSGRRYDCSPRAIFEAMQADSAYADYTFVWCFIHPSEFSDMHTLAGAKVVKIGSEEYFREMAQCAYWIFNTRVPPWIKKHAGQTYVQTWHGTPLKKLGFDVERYMTGADDKQSLQESYLTDAKRFDYLLSPSPFYTKAMTSAFHLDALGKEDAIVELGYPRNDSLYVPKLDADLEPEMLAMFCKQYQIPDGKKIILYAPTWREGNLKPAEGYGFSEGIDFQFGMNLRAFLDRLGEEYIVFVRAHYFVRRFLKAGEYGNRVFDFSDYHTLNTLYHLSDVLVTDYSSVFFDYAILKKPMVFYMYDLEGYKDVRDFYLPLTQLPGEIVTEEARLADAVKDAIEKNNEPEVQARYEAFNQTYNPIPGPCSLSVISYILEEKATELSVRVEETLWRKSH